MIVMVIITGGIAGLVFLNNNEEDEVVDKKNIIAENNKALTVQAESVSLEEFEKQLNGDTTKEEEKNTTDSDNTLIYFLSHSQSNTILRHP